MIFGIRVSWSVLLAACLLACTSGWALAAPSAATDQSRSFDLAFAVADDALQLDDIVSGRVRLGFSPLVGKGLSIVGVPGRTVWLRLRLGSARDGRLQSITLPRQRIDRVRLYLGDSSPTAVAQTGIALAPAGGSSWPDSLTLPLPAPESGVNTIYLAVQGLGHLDLQPRLRSAAERQAQGHYSSLGYGVLYGTLLVVALAAVYRRWSSVERTLRLSIASFAVLAASILGNYHLQLSLGGHTLGSVPVLPSALWIIACGPLLWATQQYAGFDKNSPGMASALDRLGLAFVLAGAAVLFLPLVELQHAQTGALLSLGATALVCAVSLLFDARQWRWLSVLLWLAVAPALAAIVLSLWQWLPSSIAVRRGFEFVLAAQLANYLLLPWLRQAMQFRARRRRPGPPELSAAEKIAHARDWMLSSLQASMDSDADDEDMEWIAYRRLMGGLKPVLPQVAAAVIAMNYHNEDLLLVEPKEAQPRFQMLLAQRGSLLKNLSRSLAPQQIGVDFNGPDGPVSQVLLAVIPLPIDRPGWGALVIERLPRVVYSDDELDLCTEFAALATTAGDEAASVKQHRRNSEVDAESGVYRREIIEQWLARAQEQSVLKHKPLSILRIGIDDFITLAGEQVVSPIRSLADLIRDEINYGETIGRLGEDEFLVVLPGRQIGEARALGERICVQVRKRALPFAVDASLRVSLGAAQLQPGERHPKLLLERAQRALAKARQYGGDQVQAVASGNT